MGHVGRMREERGVYRVLVGNLWERDHLEEPGVDGRIILKSGIGGMDRIDLARDRGRWLVPVNVVMNLRAP